ncbi:MAG: hypothetical protein U1D30_19040 [Planctomycetota bacterium]
MRQRHEARPDWADPDFGFGAGNGRSVAFCRRFLMLVGLVFASAGCMASEAPNAPFEVKLQLDLRADGRPVERRLLGNNLQWIDRGDELLLADSLDFNPDMLKLVQELHPTVLRYPGGSLADVYRWKNGVGALAERKENERFYDRHRQVVAFGTDEFLSLCARLHAEPLITVNVPSGTPEEAAEWVRYVNDREKKDGVTGTQLPKVRFWEIGNEPYLKDDRPDLALTPVAYAKKANSFIMSMKKVDPKIQVGIPLRNDRLGDLPATPLQGYATTVLETLETKPDFVCLHDAYLPFVMGGAVDEDDLYPAMMAASEVVARDLSVTRELLGRRFTGERPKIAITEYNALVTVQQKSTDAYLASQAGALYLADLIRMLSEQPDVMMANYWSMTGNWHFGAISNRGERRPAYFTLLALERILRGRLVPARVEGPTFSSPAVGFALAQSNIPLVTTIATREDGRVRLLLINKSRKGQARVTIRATWPDGGKREFARSHVRQLVATSEFSTKVNPPNGWVEKVAAGVRLPWEVTLPAASLTWIEWELEPEDRESGADA